MSEIEDAILVDRMEGVESEKFGKQSEDLLDFSDTPVVEREESPIPPTTDQLLDFAKPETTDVGAFDEDLKDTKAPTAHDGVQDIPEQEPAFMTQSDSSSPKDVQMGEEKKEKSDKIGKKKGKNQSLTCIKI